MGAVEEFKLRMVAAYGLGFVRRVTSFPPHVYATYMYTTTTTNQLYLWNSKQA